MAYDPTKTRRLTFDVTEEMYAQFITAKTNAGKTITSEALRDALTLYTQKHKKPVQSKS